MLLDFALRLPSVAVIMPLFLAFWAAGRFQEPDIAFATTPTASAARVCPR
jgi:hypothetical protein